MTPGQKVTAYIDLTTRMATEPYQYAEYYKYPGPREGETALAFRQRIAGCLRDGGFTIEAHECYTGKRWDDPSAAMGDPGAPMTGLMGAVLMDFHGLNFGTTGERRIADEMMVGYLQIHKGDSEIERMIDAIGVDNFMFLFGSK